MMDYTLILIVGCTCLVGMFGAHMQLASTIMTCKTYEKRISSMCWTFLFDLAAWGCSIWMLRSLKESVICVTIFSYITAKYMYFLTVDIKKTMRDNP